MSTSFDGDGAGTADTSPFHAPTGALPTADDDATLPADLRATQQRLLADGASWRKHLPPTDRLIQRARAELATQPTEPERAATQPAIPPLRTVYQSDSSPTPKGNRDMRETPRSQSPAIERAPKTSRWRAWVGAAVAVVVVGLLVGLLSQNGIARRTGPGAHSEATATVPPTPSGPPSQATNTDGSPAFVPIIAQSNPQIVYVVNNGKLQRSSDGGKTYAKVTLPTTDLTQTNVTATVSPLDPQRIYVTFYGLRNGKGCLPTGAPASAAPASSIQQQSASSAQQGALASLSGFGPCAEQYTSANSGGAWSRVHLPVAGVLAATTESRMILGFVSSPPYTFQAQGSVLFAMAGYSGQDGALGGGQSSILRSDDGGGTWRLVSSPPINTSTGLSVCDFAAAPSGQTLYAITGQGCNGEAVSPIFLWRSYNDGATWSQVHTFKNVAEAGMAVAANGALYLDLPGVQVYTSPSSAAPNQIHSAGTSPYSALSGGGTINAAPNMMLASANQGASFTSAPLTGVASNTNIWGPFATLANGSVVALGSPSDSSTTADALYTWKPGASSWQKTAGSVTNDTFVYAQASTVGGQETLYVVTARGKIDSFAI